MSSRFPSNSEADDSELLENIEECFFGTMSSAIPLHTGRPRNG